MKFLRFFAIFLLVVLAISFYYVIFPSRAQAFDIDPITPTYNLTIYGEPIETPLNINLDHFVPTEDPNTVTITPSFTTDLDISTESIINSDTLVIPDSENYDNIVISDDVVILPSEDNTERPKQKKNRNYVEAILPV